MKVKVYRLLVLILFVAIAACSHPDTDLIIISKDSEQRIEHWLGSINYNFEFREFYFIPGDSLAIILDNADGIVIGGGEDINPAMYGQPEFMEDCGKVDNYRDSIETLLIQYALENKIPLLGICRGQQIINVVAGGTLIPDLPKYKPGNINHRSESHSAHTVLAEPGSWLEHLSGHEPVWVNSRHHQSVDLTSEIFRIAAFAPDGVIESIEIMEEENHPFAVAVQWHPESLLDDLSIKIGREFLEHIQN